MRIEKIISSDNKKVKQLKSLSQKKYRQKYNAFFIEGDNLVKEAERAGCKFKSLVISDKYDVGVNNKFLNSVDCTIYKVSDKIFGDLSEVESHQGIGAEIEYSEKKLDLSDRDFLLILDGIKDPGNLGTILRSLDAFNMESLMLLKGTIDAYNSKVIRSSMGSIFRVEPHYYDDFEDLYRLLKDNGFKIVCADNKAEKKLTEWDFKGGKTAVILGSESGGISEDILRCADDFIVIEMPGRAESLNVAMAGTIVLYENHRQRIP